MVHHIAVLGTGQLDYYLRTACAADRMLYPHRPPIHLDPPVPGYHPHPSPSTPGTSPGQAHAHHNLAWVWGQYGDDQRALPVSGPRPPGAAGGTRRSSGPVNPVCVLTCCVAA